jgi:hypothetical protein
MAHENDKQLVRITTNEVDNDRMVGVQRLENIAFPVNENTSMCKFDVETTRTRGRTRTVEKRHTKGYSLFWDTSPSKTATSRHHRIRKHRKHTHHHNIDATEHSDFVPGSEASWNLRAPHSESGFSFSKQVQSDTVPLDGNTMRVVKTTTMRAEFVKKKVLIVPMDTLTEYMPPISVPDTPQLLPPTPAPAVSSPDTEVRFSSQSPVVSEMVAGAIARSGSLTRSCSPSVYFSSRPMSTSQTGINERRISLSIQKDRNSHAVGAIALDMDRKFESFRYCFVDLFKGSVSSKKKDYQIETVRCSGKSAREINKEIKNLINTHVYGGHDEDGDAGTQKRDFFGPTSARGAGPSSDFNQSPTRLSKSLGESRSFSLCQLLEQQKLWSLQFSYCCKEQCGGEGVCTHAPETFVVSIDAESHDRVNVLFAVAEIVECTVPDKGKISAFGIPFVQIHHYKTSPTLSDICLFETANREKCISTFTIANDTFTMVNSHFNFVVSSVKILQAETKKKRDLLKKKTAASLEETAEKIDIQKLATAENISFIKRIAGFLKSWTK